ncbi:MAG TPA: hypothetical protein VGK67_39135 [Myxococcales bacterium]
MRVGALALLVALGAGACKEPAPPQLRHEPRWPPGPTLERWSVCESADPPTARLEFSSRGELSLGLLKGVPVGSRFMDMAEQPMVATRDGEVSRVDVRLTVPSSDKATLAIVGMKQDDPEIADRYGRSVEARFASYFTEDAHISGDYFWRHPLPAPKKWCPPAPPPKADPPPDNAGQQQQQQQPTQQEQQPRGATDEPKAPMGPKVFPK